MYNHAFQSKNLLIIDDEQEILKAIYRQFRNLYSVHLANSTSQAYEILQRNSIQVIITDQRMPNMQGTDFLKTIKNEFPDIVSLLLTGYSDIKAVIEALEIGNVTKYLQKPWVPMELDKIVKEAFEKQKIIKENKHLFTQLEKAKTELEEKVKKRTLELQIANTKLEEAKDRAEKANQLKTTFLANISHEIRTPLNKILGFSELLSLNGNIELKSKNKYLNIIKQSSHELLKIIEDIIDLSILETKQIDIQKNNYPVNELLERFELETNILKRKYKKDNVEIRIQNNIFEKVNLYTDENYLNKAFLHILDNAIKFTNKGNIDITLETEEQTFIISIKDTGIGIPKEKQDIIFEDFRIAEDYLEKSYDGSGIGLSIAKKIITILGGRIGFESKENIGSVFYIYLPHLSLSV